MKDLWQRPTEILCNPHNCSSRVLRGLWPSFRIILMRLGSWFLPTCIQHQGSSPWHLCQSLWGSMVPFSWSELSTNYNHVPPSDICPKCEHLRDKISGNRVFIAGCDSGISASSSVLLDVTLWCLSCPSSALLDVTLWYLSCPSSVLLDVTLWHLSCPSSVLLDVTLWYLSCPRSVLLDVTIWYLSCPSSALLDVTSWYLSCPSSALLNVTGTLQKWGFWEIIIAWLSKLKKSVVVYISYRADRGHETSFLPQSLLNGIKL